ncbi:hypothetical protein LTR95_010078, partial [Oleoguttula sp. CCFEE 5521]
YRRLKQLPSKGHHIPNTQIEAPRTFARLPVQVTLEAVQDTSAGCLSDQLCLNFLGPSIASAALAADEHTSETQLQSKRDSKLADLPSSIRKDNPLSLDQTSGDPQPSSHPSYTSAPAPGPSPTSSQHASSSSQRDSADMLPSMSAPRKPSPQSYGVHSQGQIRPTEQGGKSPSKKSKPVVHNTGKQVRIESISAKKLKDEGKWA